MPTYKITGPDGRQFKVTGPNKDGALAALQAQLANKPSAPSGINPDTDGPMEGFGAAFRSGIDAPLENIGETLNTVGATDKGAMLQGLTNAPEGYESATGKFIEGDEDGSFAYRYLPKAAVEQIGQYAGSLITKAGGGAIGTAVGGPIGGVVGAIAGPTAFEFVQQLGPIANERARNNGRDKPNKEDFMAAASTAVTSGLFNALIPGKGGVVKKAVTEAATEGAQSVVQQTGSTAGTDVGLQIDPRQAVGEAILGGTAAGGVNVGISTVNKAGKVVLRPKAEVDPETAQAAGDVARIMQEMAETNGFNLKDIDPSSKKGAKEALEQARTVINTEIRTAQKTIKKDLYEGLDDAAKSRFEELIASAKTKVARNSPVEDIQFVKDNFGETKQGQMLVQSMYKANVTTELSAAGLKGGVSQFTDTFNPIPRIMGGSYNPMGAVAGNLNTGAAIATGGQSLAAQIPLVVGGRAIDAVTGRRSKVNRFVNKNKAQEGLGPVSGIDIEGTAQRRKDALKATKKAKVVDPQIAKDKAAKELRSTEDAQKKQFYEELEARRNVQQYLAGEGPKEGSPREILHSVIENTYGAQDRTTLELDAEIKRTLSEMLSDASVTAERKMAIRDYFKTVEGGKSIIEGSPLNDVTSMMRSKSSGFKSKAKPKDKADPKLPARQEAGKIANQAALATLKSKAAKDTSIRKEDRKSLNAAFKELSNPLGKNPVDRLGKIVAKAEGKLMDSKLSEKYLKPYVDRIKEQQPKDNLNPVGFGLY